MASPKILLIALLVVVLGTMAQQQVSCNKLYCQVKYKFDDAGCAPCCERLELIAVREDFDTCKCRISYAQEFREKFPNVAK